MSSEVQPLEELNVLLDQLALGELTAEEISRFEELVSADPALCDRYLRWAFTFAGLRSSAITLEDGDVGQMTDWSANGGGIAELSPTVSEHSNAAAAFPSEAGGYLPNLLHGAASFFSSGWSVAYLITTVIFGIGALVGSAILVSPPTEIVQRSNSSNPQSLIPNPLPKAKYVGQVTRTVGCKWSGTERPTREVVLGSTYHLAAGLAEITYKTGARVILQGPVTFEVNSDNGGHLSAGRLTARVEKKAEKVASGQWPVAGESQISSLRSDVPDSPPSALRLPPSLSTNHCPLFTIETPTAIVTDLGTEFGVEVNDYGNTVSHVFRGSVKVHRVGNDGISIGAGQVLHENETVRVERRGSQSELVTLDTFTPSHFIRELPEPADDRRVITLDLVDVVAGGDGFSQKRDRGIDPTNGRLRDRPPSSADYILHGNSQYHRVAELPFVDGVFVPDLRDGPVRVDSAAHAFADTSRSTSSAHLTSGFIWAGGPISIPPCIQTEEYSAYVKSLTHLPVVLDGVDYSSPEHGVLCLHPNKGITFDLDAIRRANADATITRFRAVAANVDIAPELAGLADIRVLIDGKTRFQRRETPRSNAAFSINVPISETDRFLTLMTTDGDDSFYWDWVVFGDPRLELNATAKQKQPETKTNIAN